MLTFGLVISKGCITYSMNPCNKLWRRLECLNIQTTEVNRPSTKQSTNRPSTTSLVASLEPLAHRRNVASLSLFYRYYFGRCSSELTQLVPLPFSRGGLLVIPIDCMIFLSPFLDVTRMSMSTVSFLAQLNSGILCI